MFDKRLRSLRKDRNMTQKEVATELGIAKSTIGMYEAGQRHPDTEMLQLLSKYFGVSTDYLLGVSDIKIPMDVSANEKIRALLEDPDMLVAFHDYENWTEEEKEDLISYIEFKRSRKGNRG